MNTATRLALEAGELCLRMQDDLETITYKDEKDLVTAADLAADALISKGLLEAFPDHCLRTEEAGAQGNPQSEWEWIIDPIDGTVNYSRGMPMWGISIALLHKGVPQLAVCNLPRLGELFLAEKGQGATRNGKPIRVSRTQEIGKSIVSNGDFNVGRPFGLEALNQENLENFRRQSIACQRVKCVGSAVVEGCFVACGRLDAYCMTVSYPWDIAGVVLLVQEAGGMVTSLYGGPLEIKDGAKVVFTNGVLHQDYLDMLHR